MSLLILFLAAFAASAVEMVEALTIVVAVGVTRGWRSPIVGVGAAFVALAASSRARARAHAHPDLVAAPRRRRAPARLRAPVAAEGDPACVRLEGAARRGRDLRPRAGGRAGGRPRAARPIVDWFAFTVSFKGVFLEGLEVAFIVISFGGTKGGVPVAAAAAALALVHGRDHRLRRPRAAQPGAGERAQVRGRDDADDVRHRSGPRRAPARTGPAATRRSSASSPSSRSSRSSSCGSLRGRVRRAAAVAA